MPRPRRTTADSQPVVALARIASPPSVRALRGVSAAGARIVRDADKPKGNGPQQWQMEAWSFLDTVGELAFAVQWISNALSRAELFIGHETAEGEVERIEVGPAVDILDTLASGPSGQSQMLAAFGTHLTVPGEGWLVGVPQPLGDDLWRVLSNRELKKEGTKWVIDRGDGRVERYEDGSRDDFDAEAFVLRIWRPHPALWVEATSPIRAALPILRELEGLTKHVAASIDSRLAGAGLLLVPSELSFQTPADDTAPEDERADDLLDALIKAAEAAIQDRGDPSAVLPTILQAPGAVLGNVQHITFATPFSEQALELRTEAIRRLALSIDLPPEVLLGQSDSNHWSAWLISEDAIKVHIEPLLELITSALTTEYLWPALRNTPGGPGDVERWTIKADTSALRLRPQRTAEAQALHGDLVLTDAALARETGFDDSDLLVPGSEEFHRRLLMKLASGVTTADLTLAAIEKLGVELKPQASEVETAEAIESGGSAPPAGELPPPAEPETPATEAPREPPGQAASGSQRSYELPREWPQLAGALREQHDRHRHEQTAALVVGAELVCLRAMERANNRIGKRRGAARPMDAEQLATALTGAWDNVPRVAAMSGVDAAELQAACEHYVRGRLQAGAAHDPVRLVRYLEGLTRG